MVRILYVEDNEDNIYMLQNRLRRQGFDVLIARDGASGVAVAKAERPDLILMDLGLPVMDGWEASRRLKADDATSNIPVIALSAHAMSNDKAEALEAGCDEYDVKPVEWGRLLTKIRALLPPGAAS
jgi:two-component system cell cycle response regulator DivK